MKKGSDGLFRKAVMDLKEIGYKSEYLPSSKTHGRNMKKLSKDGDSFIASIQTHSKDYNSRYTVGITLIALQKSDFHIMWMENEKTMFIIPSQFLLDIWQQMEEEGNARYSSVGKQWRVVFFPNDERLKPQMPTGLSGQEYDIEQFAVNSPQIWKTRKPTIFD